MVGMEDGPYNARRGIDPDDDSLFRGPPSLFDDDEDDYLDNLDAVKLELASWDVDEERDDSLFRGDVSLDGLLPAIGLFDVDDDPDLFLLGSTDDVDDSEVLFKENGRGEFKESVTYDFEGDNASDAALGPSWTDERTSVPPVVLHPAPEVDSRWSQSAAPVVNHLDLPGEDDEPDEIEEDEGSFRKSRRLNRFLMVLTVLVVAGVVGAVYTYLNREQSTPAASAGSDVSTSDGTESTEGSNVGQTASVLVGPDPVAILTTGGTFRIVTQTDGASAEYGNDPTFGTPKFIALTDTMAFVVNDAGTAWRINYRTDPTPQSLVDLNKDKTEPPPATTIYHFASAEDGTVYFTDVDGNVWELDPTPNASLVYSPQAPDSAVAQLAANATTLFVRTIGGDVLRHERGGDGATLAYGPSNDNPEIISIAPTESGVILTAIGGIVRVVDPTQEEPLTVIYKPNGDKGVEALPAGAGAAVLTKAGNLVYAVAGSENIPAYTPDGAKTKPPLSRIVGLGNGAIGAVDADGSIWLVDLSSENASKIWDAAALGPVSSVQPTQDAFAVIDDQGNVWSLPGMVGGVAQELSASSDARSITTERFSLDGGAS